MFYLFPSAFPWGISFFLKLGYAIDCFDPSSQARRAREAVKDVVEEGARLEDIAGGSVAGGSSGAPTESDASQV